MSACSLLGWPLLWLGWGCCSRLGPQLWSSRLSSPVITTSVSPRRSTMRPANALHPLASATATTSVLSTAGLRPLRCASVGPRLRPRSSAPPRPRSYRSRGLRVHPGRELRVTPGLGQRPRRRELRQTAVLDSFAAPEKSVHTADEWFGLVSLKHHNGMRTVRTRILHSRSTRVVFRAFLEVRRVD
jgi:hypothetical protein